MAEILSELLVLILLIELGSDSLIVALHMQMIWKFLWYDLLSELLDFFNSLSNLTHHIKMPANVSIPVDSNRNWFISDGAELHPALLKLIWVCLFSEAKSLYT
jgi:hypothetical protein